MQGEFRIQEAVSADARATVYRATRDPGRRPVLLKVLERRPPRPREVEYLRNELKVAKDLDPSKILRPLVLGSYKGMPALVREDFSGIPLERLMTGPLGVEQFLELAIAITAALEHVHRGGVVHRALSARNIFVKPETNEIRLTEFGLASFIPREPQSAELEVIEGAMPYMSPEQSGRTHRVVDTRSDLYSLGVVFFQMLTGALPFQARDPLGWVHAHVAQPVPSPGTLASGVPEILSALVLRLLAKMPEDRYQSAHGVLADLERVRRALPEPEMFPLGEHDISSELRISQHLYGRGDELKQLRRAIAPTLESGRPGLVLVSGHSGVGKSALVYTTRDAIERSRATFLSGKFDVQRRSVPYSTIIQAFRPVLRDILAGSGARLTHFRSRLEAALGQNGRLITDMIPEAELLLGPQPAITALPPLETEERFRSVLHAFITTFASAERPLVLFLDDLQWADPASLKLLQRLLSARSTQHLLIIGAFRNNELDSEHPLTRTLAELRQTSVRVEEIHLGPLGVDHVVALIADTLRRPALEVRSLAELVHEKTGGNPFFVHQFLEGLARDALLVFDTERWRWRWDLERIRQHAYTENVAEFMVERLASLPERTQQLTRLAACVGNILDVKTFATIAGVDETELDRLLAPALEQNLLTRGLNDYRFAHDRVQQAAYSLVPEAERVSVHLCVGRRLLHATPDAGSSARVFDITHQLNLGAALITDPEERLALARLNLAAGRKARDAAAPATALQYLRTAIGLLGEEHGWEVGYDVLLPAHLIGAECAFLGGDLEEAFRLLAPIEQHGRSILDRTPGRNLHSWLLFSQGNLPRASEYSVETARLLGLSLPSLEDETGIRAAVAEAFAEFQAVLAGRSVESLVELPLLEGPVERALFETLHHAIPGTFQWNPDLMALLTLKGLLLAGKERTASAFFYVQYGIVHFRLTEDYDTAFRFGELAIRLAERKGDPSETAGIHFIHALFLSHLRRHISVSLQHLEIAARLSRELFEPVLSNYCASMGLVYRFFAGEALDTIQHDLDDIQAGISQSGDVINLGFISATRQAILALKGRTSKLECLDDSEFSEAAFESTALPTVRSLYGATKMLVRFLGGDFAGALLAARTFVPFPGLFYSLWRPFLHGLALAREAEAATGEERERLIEQLKEDVRCVAKLAEQCEANHGHRDKLLRAELGILEGRTLEALRLYDQASGEAGDHGFFQEQALACELAARALRTSGFEFASRVCLEEARRAYQRWGAEGKVRELERRFPGAALSREPAPEVFFSCPEALDMTAAIKASGAISRELNWKRVSERLLQVSLEQSGGTYGCLMIRRNGEPLVAAVARVEGTRIVPRLLDLVPIAQQQPVVPRSVVNFVSRTRELVVFDETGGGNGYSNDPYIRAVRPRSFLCLPILRQFDVIAVLYVENQLASGVFTRPRVAALELIAGQAAIALSNAELFEKLERENVERKRAEEFLRESRGLLQQIIDNASALIFVKDRQGRYLLTNRRFDELLHMDHEDILGKTDRDLTEREWARTYRTNDLLALEANRPLDFEEQVPFPGGPHTYLALKFPLHDAEGRAYAVCGISTDITERKKAENQLRESMHREREARTAAEEAVRLRDEFLSVASHELRTPLTSLELAIYGLSRRLGSPPAPAQHSLQVADRQVRRLGSLVSSLLDVSRIQSGHLVLEARPVDLGTLVRDAVEQLADDLRRSGSELTLHIEEPVVGVWDASRIEQIVVNLVSNATKFGEGKPIDVSVKAENGRAYLTVFDHGMGIPEDVQRRLFRRFSRGVSARHYGGLGLGLYIVDTIARAHGGRVWVTSSSGKGACFTVELPRSPPPAATGAVPEKPS